MRSFWREKYAVMRLKRRETSKNGTMMNAKEIAVDAEEWYCLLT